MPSQSAPPDIDETFLTQERKQPGFALRRLFPFSFFPPELETEYRHFAYRSYQQTRSIAIKLLILSLLAFFFFDVIMNYKIGENAVTLPIMVMRLSAIAITLVAANQVLGNTRVATADRWIPIVLGSLSLIMLLITLLYFRIIDRTHLPFGLEGMMLIEMAIFFPIGYSYRNSLLLGVITLMVTYTATALSLPASLRMPLNVSMAYLAVASIAAGLGGYCQEQSMRTLFLAKRELLGIANTDGLTQLNNRRTFDLLLQRSLQEAQREEKRVALIMLDLDHFKAYNDLYGHPAGDLALQNVAAVLALYQCRELDFAARLGGEEFALVLRDPDDAYLISTCEGIRQQIHRELAIEHLGSPNKVMTASVGASFSQLADTPASLYQRTDQALYRAKGKGRNRVEMG